MSIQITKDNFEQEVLHAEKPVLLDFWATWCGPCRMLAPVLDEIEAAHPEIIVGKVNVDEEDELARQYNVMSIPLLVLMKNGKRVANALGLQAKEIIEEMLQAE